MIKYIISPFTVFLLSLGAYSLTLAPTIAGGDSPEFVAVAHNLGIAHPPGYPLYTLLGHFWISLFKDAAWAMNFLSAICGAITSAVLYFSLTVQLKNRLASALLAMVFSFAPLIWRFSVVTEVFMLNALLVALALWFSTNQGHWQIKIFGKPEVFSYILFGSICGLAICHHHTSVFFLFPVGVWYLWQAIKHKKINILYGVATGALICLLYLHLWIAGNREDIPKILWGLPKSLEDVLFLVLRKEYGTFNLAQGGGISLYEGLLKTFYFFKSLAESVLYIGLIPFVWGIYCAMKKGVIERIWTIALFIYVLTFSVLSNLPENSLTRFVQNRFWIQALVVSFWLVGLGLKTIVHRWPKISSASLLGCMIAQIALHYPTMDHSKNLVTREYVKTMLDTVQPNSIILVNGDSAIHGLLYMQIVENYRTDVHVLPHYFLGKDWFNQMLRKYHPQIRFPPFQQQADGTYSFTIEDFVRENVAAGIPFYTSNSLEFVFAKPSNLDFVPLGLVEKVGFKHQMPTNWRTTLAEVRENMLKVIDQSAQNEDPWDMAVKSILDYDLRLSLQKTN